MENNPEQQNQEPNQEPSPEEKEFQKKLQEMKGGGFEPEMPAEFKRAIGSIPEIPAGVELEAPVPPVREKERAPEEAVSGVEEGDGAKKVEAAWKVLAEEKVMDRNPKEIKKAFREATGENLPEKRERMVDANMGARHMTVIRGAEAVEAYKQKVIIKEKAKITAEKHADALDTLWARNPNITKPEDREKYLNDIKKKLGLDGPSGTSVIDRLINEGYAVEKAKKSWLSGKIKIPTISGNLSPLIGSIEDVFSEKFKLVIDDAAKDAQKRADIKIIEGRKRLLAERVTCTKAIISQTVEKYNLEKQQVREAEEAQTQTEAIKENERRDKAAVAGKEKVEKEKEKEKVKKVIEKSVRPKKKVKKKPVIKSIYLKKEKAA